MKTNEKRENRRIIGVKNAKVTYGTVNSVEFKSLYLNIQTWVQPIRDSENWQRVVLNFSREIKHLIYEKLDRKLFEEKFIVDLDLRSSGISVGKKSFANLEINLFLKQNDLDFKSTGLKDSLKKITKGVFDNTFAKNEYFKFHLTKSLKSEKGEVKIEKV